MDARSDSTSSGEQTHIAINVAATMIGAAVAILAWLRWRDTGESVLQMAGRINEVSAQAQETAQVARQSLDAARDEPRLLAPMFLEIDPDFGAVTAFTIREAPVFWVAGVT